MVAVVTIVQLETSINDWRNRKPAKSGVLCREASVLAELYGEMICQKQNEKPIADLSDTKIEFLKPNIRHPS